MFHVTEHSSWNPSRIADDFGGRSLRGFGLCLAGPCANALARFTVSLSRGRGCVRVDISEDAMPA